MAYAVGHVSGGHFNPVTLGLWSAGRCASRHAIPYIVSQVIGAVAGWLTRWMYEREGIVETIVVEERRVS